jgi:hypothetical protein
MIHIKVYILTIVLLCGLGTRRVNASPSSTKSYPTGRDRPHHYQIQSDKLVYSGWRRVIRRTVSSLRHPHHYDEYNPKKHLIDFDIIDQNQGTCGAVIVFAWNSTSKTATIVREYMPGCHRILGGLAAGLVEEEKHTANLDLDNGEDRNLMAARCELEEEW